MPFSIINSPPRWRSKTLVEDLWSQLAHSSDAASAILQIWDCQPSTEVALMRGTFNWAAVGSHTYTYVFVPGRGPRAVALPVYSGGQMVDVLAMSPKDPDGVWGCVTGHASHIGNAALHPLPVFRSPASWLLRGCNGVLPLQRSYYPYLSAFELVVEDYEHGIDLVDRVFIDTADMFGTDRNDAEKRGIERISVAA